MLDEAAIHATMVEKLAPAQLDYASCSADALAFSVFDGNFHVRLLYSNVEESLRISLNREHWEEQLVRGNEPELLAFVNRSTEVVAEAVLDSLESMEEEFEQAQARGSER